MTANQMFNDETPAMRRRRLGKMEPGTGRAIAFTVFLWLLLLTSPFWGTAGCLLGVGMLCK